MDNIERLPNSDSPGNVDSVGKRSPEFSEDAPTKTLRGVERNFMMTSSGFNMRCKRCEAFVPVGRTRRVDEMKFSEFGDWRDPQVGN